MLIYNQYFGDAGPEQSLVLFYKLVMDREIPSLGITICITGQALWCPSRISILPSHLDSFSIAYR